MIIKSSIFVLNCFFILCSHTNCEDFSSSYYHRRKSQVYGNNNHTNKESILHKKPFCRKQDQFEDKLNEPLLPQCTNSSVESLLSGINIKGPIDRGDLLLPPWVNLPLAIRGQQFAKNNLASMGMAHLYGLTILLSLPQTSELLLFTGSSDTPAKAAKRYAATMLQVILWLRGTLSKDPNNNWIFQSLSNVNYLHQSAGKQAALSFKRNKSLGLQKRFESTHVNEARWAAFNQDLFNSSIPPKRRKLPQRLIDESGDNFTEPINQFSFALTQWAFLSIPVLYPREVLLFNVNDDDLYAFTHFWAVLGYALGIKDEFNVALHPDINSTRKYLQEIFDIYFLPGLFNINHGSKILLDSVLEAMADLSIGLDAEFLLRRVLKEILKIPAQNMDLRRTPLGYHEDNFFYTLYSNPMLTTELIRVQAPLFSLSHIPIGFRYFGYLYTSDESIAKNCFYYHSHNNI